VDRRGPQIDLVRGENGGESRRNRGSAENGSTQEKLEVGNFQLTDRWDIMCSLGGKNE
jgi:hypothetical protein